MKEVFIFETFQALSDRLDMFIEENEVYQHPDVTIVIEKVTEGGNYHWKATLMLEDTKETMIKLLCEEHEVIRHIWDKNDIRELETVRPLTEEEVDQIAMDIERYVDCEYGINWQYIQDMAEQVAPDAFEVDEAE